MAKPEPTYTWAQIEEALCEIRLESFSVAPRAGVTEKDGQLTTRGVIIVNLQRKLHQLFPGAGDPGLGAGNTTQSTPTPNP